MFFAKSPTSKIEVELIMFPPIESPCPLQFIQLPQEGNFNCSMCKREVHDLSAMNHKEIQTFLSQCSGKVCVSYKVKTGLKSLKQGAVAGLFMVTAAGLALPVAAQVGVNLEEDFEELIMVGGIKLPENTQLVDENEHQSKVLDKDDTMTLIPIVEESDESNW